ncbi:YbfJ family protein [Bacillus wiedmannii]|uniref:YbfJ family protein n=1 Tax=Bacillus wiedmannii TaxID=1890302 RepID=UPI0021D3D54B|nr:YbfJ family protein [Bacillus wiedmannii]MCU5093431.1 YbfJ family protein [Bacillus wiedmannii]
MCLIILKNALNKYSKLIWILCYVLVIIIIFSFIANNEKMFSKVVNYVTFYVNNKEKQPVKDFEIILMKDASPEPSKEIGISIGRTDEEGKVIWRNVRKGNYIIFLPNGETQIVRINDRDETRVINILL